MDDIERLFEEKISQIIVSETNSSVPSSVMIPFVTAIETPLASTVAAPPVSISTTPCKMSVNIQADFVIETNMVLTALQGCLSWRNLAARRAVRTFTPEERIVSNCWGVCGKQALNTTRLDAIMRMCLKYFPLDCLEKEVNAFKDMRNAVDEACRKTKLNDSENVVPRSSIFWLLQFTLLNFTCSCKIFFNLQFFLKFFYISVQYCISSIFYSFCKPVTFFFTEFSSAVC